MLALISPVGLAKERTETRLKLTKKDGTAVEGVLLAVRGRDLILRGLSSSEEITENISELSKVRIVKKSKLLKGMGNGFLWGGAAGAGLGALMGSSHTPDPDSWFDLGPRNAGEGAIGGAIVFGTIAGLAGGIGGALSGIDRTFRLEGKSEIYLNGMLEMLRQRALDSN
jgi:hypothetical protein